jgi:glutamyl-tRNA reductase
MRVDPSVVQVGVDHRGVTLPVLERLQSRRSEPPPLITTSGLGLVRLATCHRLELYAEGADVPLAIELWRSWLGLSKVELAALRGGVAVRDGANAGRHLLRVAAGLESVVLGEDQIQGQVRQAYRRACAAHEPGPLLHRLFHAAFRAGKRARGETTLKQGGRSLAGCGVAFLAHHLGGLAGKTFLVIGTGEMGTIASTRLKERGAGRLLLTNRTWSRAETLATELNAESLRWAWRAAALTEVDGAICACHAPEPVVRAEWLCAAAAPQEKLVVVDLAVPRGVERPPVMPPGLVLADVETLAAHLRRDADLRLSAVDDAEGIVEEELGEWLAWVQARIERTATQLGRTPAVG